MNIDVQTWDLDMNVLVENVLQSAEVEERVSVTALHVVMERCLGEELLDLLGGGSHGEIIRSI